MYEVTSREMKSGQMMVSVSTDGEIACDIVVSRDGKTVTLGMDAKPTSGAMTVDRAARPNWKRHRFERLP
jgi:hypothetical protein